MENKWQKAGVVGQYLCLLVALWEAIKPSLGGKSVSGSSIALVLASLLFVVGQWIIKRRPQPTLPPEAHIEPSVSPVRMPEDLHKDCLSQTKYRALTLERTIYEPANPANATIQYRDKIRFLIVNTSAEGDIDVWSPLWEVDPLEGIKAQAPLASSLMEESQRNPDGTSSSSPYPWGEEKPCMILLPATGEGLAIRIARGKTGYLVFPLKIGAKLLYEKIKI